MKNNFTLPKCLLFFFSTIICMHMSTGLYAQNVPELIYYKFEDAGTNVTNHASTPVGNNPATISGTALTQGGTGQFGGGLQGTGGSSSTDVINTGWNTSLAGSWTISLYLNNIPSSTTLFYYFGDAGAGSFRCFTNGVAGANNLMIRGSFTDVIIPGGATVGVANVCHFVYDATVPEIRGYYNGVLSVTVPQAAINLAGTGFQVGGYATNSGLSGTMDEFRFYDRALTATEISTTWNQSLPLLVGANDAGIQNIVSPTSPTIIGSQPVSVNIFNFGSANLTSSTINWEVNGIAGTPFNYVGNLASLTADGPILLGNANFVNGNNTVKAWTSNPNGQTDANNANDTVQINVFACPAITGVYTINSGAATGGTNFNSFTDAVSAISQCGITGAVTFNVMPGTYNEQISIPQIMGSSSTNTITFNGNGETISFASAVSTQRAVITLNGADYVTINNLNINAAGGTYGWGVHLTNDASFNIISYCNISTENNSTSTNYAGLVISGSTSGATTAGNNGHNNLITNNTINGGYYGISNMGASGNPGMNNHFVNNTVQNMYFYGFYCGYQDGMVVRGNDISRAGRTAVTSMYGVYLWGSASSCIIEKNRIHNTHDIASSQTGLVYGIYVNIGAPVGFETQVVNNLIYNFNSGSGTIYALYMNDSGIKVYHNTVSLDNTTSTGGITRGIFIGSSSYSNIDLKNNIISITRGGTGTKHGIYTVSTLINSNNNIINIAAPAGTNYFGRWGTTDYATLALWNGASGQDANSFETDPLFAAPGAGDFTPTNGLVNNAGTAVGVTTDILGTTRDPFLPDPGAFEFDIAGLDAAITWVSPVNPISAGSHPIVVNIANTQTATINSVNLSYTDGVNPPVIQTFSSLNLTAGNNVDLTFTTPYNFTGIVTLTATINTVNGGTDAIAGNNTASVTVCPALSGVYTINPVGGDFSSLTAAVTALASCGISSSVTFNVAVGSGPYNEQIAIPEITGSSSTNTITFNGNGETISFSSNDGNNRAVIRLEGADYVTIDNFVIDASGPGTYGWGIHFMNSSDYATISNNTVITDVISTSSVNYGGIIASGSLTSMTTTGDATNNTTIINNTITGGYYGIAITGTSSSILSTGNQIIGNTIVDHYLYGIRVYYQDAPVMTGNDVTQRVASTSGYGIYTLSVDGAAQIISNRLDGWGTYGIYLSTFNSTGVARPIVANNMISSNPTTGTYGIYMVTAKEVDLWYNSINIGGTGRALYISSSTTTNVDIRNNSFAYSGTGTGYAMYISSTLSVSALDHNNYYSTGSNFVYYGGAKADLAALQATNTPVGNDANSRSGNPEYLSATDLHSVGLQLNNGGTPIAAITVDIDGDTRDPINPNIGADEYTPPPYDIGVSALIEPAAGGCFAPSSDVVVEVYSLGTDPVDFSNNNLTISVNITGPLNQNISTTLTTGTLIPGNTLNIPVGSVNLSAAGTYVFDITASMPGDGIAFNNNLVVNVISTGEAPVITSTTGDTTCGIGSVTLMASASAGTISWYDAPTGGSLLGTGPSYTTTIATTTDFYVQSESGFVSGSLNAMPLAGGNSCGGGNMFNITPNSSLDITGFNMNLGASSGTSVTVNVYYKTGTYVGSQLIAGDWTFHQAVIVTAAGPNNASFVPVNPLSLGAGTLYGIYLNADVNYTNITPPVIISNADLTLELGDGLCGLFSGNNVGRGFNGTVFYSAGCASQRVAVTAVSTPADQVTISGITDICEGSSTTLTVSSANVPYIYTWEPAAGLNTTSGAVVVANPTATTTYIVTGDDGTCVDTDTVEVTVWPTSASGNAGLLSDTICSGADATLTLTGSIGDIQWQENTGSGWVNISGATYTPYDVVAPLNGTQFRAVVTSGVCPSATSNELTLYTVTPLVLTSNGDTRCGPGIVNLMATGTSDMQWYDAASGGNLVGTGNNFDPFVTATTDFYVQSTVGGGGAETAPLPAEVSGFNGNVRGHWFTSPVAFTITGLKVPGTTTTQSIAVVRFNPAVPPPVFSGTTNDFVTLFLTQNNTNTGVIPVSISVNAGDVIGILGQRETTTSYGPTGSYTTTIAGFPVDLTRMGMQFSLTTTAPQDIWQEPTGSLGLIEMKYSSGCSSPRVPVTATVTSAPAAAISSSALVSCGGAPVTLTASSTNDPNYSYSWQPGGQTGASVIVTPIENTTYIVHAIDLTTGCENYDTLDLEVVAAPQLSLSSMNGTFFCDVANTQLIADAGSGGGTVGAPDLSIGAFATWNATAQWLNFTVLDNTTIQSVDMFFQASALNSSFSIVIRDALTLANVFTHNDVVSTVGTSTPQTIAINATLPPGDYQMNIGSAIGTYRNSTGGVYPYTIPGVISITGNTFNPVYYYMFYNWQIAGAAVSYQWSPTTGLSDPYIANPIATPNTTTTYTIVVTDTVTGCTSTDNVTIIVEATPVPAISSSTSMPLCEGTSTILSTQYTSANGFTFDWNGLFNTEDITVSQPGDYTVLVTSPNGCVSNPVIQTVTVATIFADIIVTNVSCYGGNNGTVTVDALGSVIDPGFNLYFGPFLYAINGGPLDSSNVFTGLSYGPYVFTVHDPTTGCNLNINGFVSEPDELFTIATVNYHVSCNGLSDGSATASATGGTGPYTFDWLTPTPKSGETNNDIPAGTWTVVGTDANGCTATTTVTVTEPDVLIADLGTSMVIPWGTANGYTANGCTDITVSVVGGTAPYSYLWSTGDTTNPMNICYSKDTIVTFTVTVTDANGCTATATVTYTWANIDCSNNSNGTKVKICFVPPGNPENCQTICIAVSAAAGIFSNTPSYLGSCQATCPTARVAAPEITDKLTVNLFPNPTTGKVIVDYMSENTPVTNIVVMDIQGRVLFNIPVSNRLEFAKEVDMSNLENGLYIINLISIETVISSSRVVKTH